MGTISLKIPTLVSGVDICSLPLNTTDAFIISCIDGLSSIEDISFISGIEIEKIANILRRLGELGVVSWEGETEGETGEKKPSNYTIPADRKKTIKEFQSQDPDDAIRAEESTSHLRSQEEVGGGKDQTVSPLTDPNSGPVDMQSQSSIQVYNVSELEEDVDIGIERRKQILEMYSRLQREQTHYQILGVSEDADKKQIRSVYFELSRVFHTDSVFGKRLGSYKTKMEIIFKHLTEAYEVLSRKKKRKEYDEYLAATAQTRQVEQVFAQVHRPKDSIHPFSGSCQPVGQRDGEGTMYNNGFAVSVPESRDSENSNLSSLTPEQRRYRMQRILRMRLSAVTGQTPTLDSIIPSPSMQPKAGRGSEPNRVSLIRDLASSLKAASTVTGGQAKVIHYLESARRAEKNNELLSAANYFQLALSIASDRQDIKQECERIRLIIANSFSDKYEQQAIYEEKSGKWGIAAQSWIKVSNGRPTEALPAFRAASALLKTGDLTKAQRYAQRAVDLEPTNVSNITMLARIYLAGGLRLNAKRELHKASKLEPKNEVVKHLLKEVR